MSHFILTVCMTPPPAGVTVDQKLKNMLAPYDENMEVPEYRNYDDAAKAEDFWLYKSIKRTADEVANGDRSSVKPYRPNEIGYSSAFDTKRTEEQQWEDLQKEAEDFQKFSSPPTWPEVIEYSNNRWYPEGLDDDNRHSYTFYEEETDRAYTLSTYNPDSKWDWYQIGGRWRGYFPAAIPVEDDVNHRLITSPKGWSAPDVETPNSVDGGPKGMLDLRKLREDKADETEAAWYKYHSLVAGLPVALNWEHFCKAVEDERMTWDEARATYGGQPRVKKARESSEFMWGGCPIGIYGYNVDDDLALSILKEKARQDAVPGFALLTTEGKWVAPGEMGWFGMSSDTEESKREFKDAANEYIDNLDPDVLLIAVDLHI